MAHTLGLDIGGTKIAGAVFDDTGKVLVSRRVAMTKDYESFLATLVPLVKGMETEAQVSTSVGIAMMGAVDRATGVIQSCMSAPFLVGHSFRDDLALLLDRPIRIANDINCATMAEAEYGAGHGYELVMGVVVGTGVGGALVFRGQLIEGHHGLFGEWGHTPLSFREASDGVVDETAYMPGRVEQLVAGPALQRLHYMMSGRNEDAEQIASLASSGDQVCLKTLDRYYDVFAKAMVTVIHCFDPDVIVLTGGISNIAGLYTEVPKRWARYTVISTIRTQLVKASLGDLAGVTGAALLWR